MAEIAEATAEITDASFGEMSDAALMPRAGGGPLDRNRPSSIGHPCIRHLVLLRTVGLPPWPIDKLRLFEAGLATERALIRHFTRSPQEKDSPGLGWDIQAQQGYVQIPDAEMWGRIEGTIAVPKYCYLNGVRYVPRLPGKQLFEVKGLNPYAVSKLTAGQTVEEAFQDHRWYYRYPAQGQSYLLAHRQKTMTWFVCPRGDHLDFVELTQTFDPIAADLLVQKSNMIDEIVDKILNGNGHGARHAEKRTVEELVAAAPAPEWIAQCEGCDFERRCWDARPIADGELVVLDDPALEDALDQLEDLKPSFAQYNQIDKRVKAQVENVENTRCGHWLIGGRRIDRKGYTVEAGSSWRRNIKRVKEEKM